MLDAIFRPFYETDIPDCLSLFDANCPEFFATNEREDYRRFLDTVTEGYSICELDGKVCGAFGVLPCDQQSMRLNWILLDPHSQGVGIGSKIMRHTIRIVERSNANLLKIAASQKSAPFFQKFGATVVASLANGWGPGMDRIDMELPV